MRDHFLPLAALAGLAFLAGFAAVFFGIARVPSKSVVATRTESTNRRLGRKSGMSHYKWGRVVVLVAVEVVMLPKRKSVAEMLTDHIEGSPAEKLALLDKLKARGGFDAEDRAELVKVENMLRTVAAAEKKD